jgi:L-fucose isomerase-like protein
MSLSQNDGETVTTKWGIVVILRDDNYALWRDIAQLAIASANAWDIIARNEACPANLVAAKEWDTQSANAMRIINMSINQSYLSDLIPFAIIKDVEGAWDELAKHDRSNDPIWVSDVRSRFRKEVFDLATQTVCKFVNTLCGYASKILGTNCPIKDSEIRKRLLLALPKGVGSELWQQAKQWCLRDLLDLN